MKDKPLHLRIINRIILINILFILISGLIIFFNTMLNVNKLADTIKEETQAEVINQISNYFSPAETIVQSMSTLLYRNFSDLIQNTSSRQIMYGFFKDIMIEHPQFKMISFSDTHGAQELLYRMDDGTFSKQSVRNDGNQITIAWEHENNAWLSYFSDTAEPALTGFDPRRKGWYGTALSTHTSAWTGVYLFTADNLPGLSCVASVYDNAGKLTGVSSISIAVKDLSLNIGNIKPTPGTKIFLLDSENNLAAFQAESEADMHIHYTEITDDQGRITYEAVSVSTLQDEDDRFLLETLLENGNEQIKIRNNGTRYRAGMAPITIGNNLNLILCVFIPENDITGLLQLSSIIIAVFFIFTFIFTLILKRKLLRFYKQSETLHLSEPPEQPDVQQLEEPEAIVNPAPETVQKPEPEPEPEPEPKQESESKQEPVESKPNIPDIITPYLKDIQKIYGIKNIVSEETYKNYSDVFEFRFLDRIGLKETGKCENIYELISLKNGISSNLNKIYRHYETGLTHYFDKNWAMAYKYFSFVLKYCPNDAPAKIMRSRCVQYYKNPPRENWNGIETNL